MHLPQIAGKTKSPLTISDIAPKFDSTNLAATILYAVLALAAIVLLVLLATLPAEGQTETVLYNFSGHGDGSIPTSALVWDGAGNLYGTTVVGGSCDGWNQYGCGVVFELSPNGSGGWNQSVLHTFSAPPDGANPFCAPVIFDSVGNIYGTTEFGGTYNSGSVYELSPVAGGWTDSILYSFNYNANGDHPSTGLTMDAAGNLYGTNSEYESPGGVFELSPSAGGWNYQVIYLAPTAQGVTMDAAGNLFGATDSTVFELSPDGNGGWNPTVIHTFTGAPDDGISPYAAPVLDAAGNLYGTTSAGGANNLGTVYKLVPGGNGEWTEQILYSFAPGSGGNDPRAGVVLDAAGNLYGTTSQGGIKNKNYGTVFELIALGGSNYQYLMVWAFNGKDGSFSEADVTLDSAGNLYGTTAQGGTSKSGLVFEVSGVRRPTTAALTSAPNPSAHGQPVTFTAVITPAPPDGETVSFMKGKTIVLGTGLLTAGVATFTTSALPVGTTKVTAVYGGDSTLAGSTSNVVKQVVKRVKK
jgi:uncharacterized repeat protein (TIGR03803 family)